jgi:hypothetical protein
MATLGLVCGYVICVFIGLLGALVIWRIVDGSIDLSRLISEPNGDASMSRFQFLVFTFVIALSLFLVIASQDKPQFPNVPATILTLLGISGSSYLVSKGIQFSDPAGLADRPDDIAVSPAKAIVRLGQTQQFKADLPRTLGSEVKWEVIAGYGTIDDSGLYKAPETPPPALVAQPAAAGAAAHASAPHWHATIQATSVDCPDATDLAVVTLI